MVTEGEKDMEKLTKALENRMNREVIIIEGMVYLWNRQGWFPGFELPNTAAINKFSK